MSGIEAGTYSFNVTDLNGCTASNNTIIITEPAQLEIIS